MSAARRRLAATVLAAILVTGSSCSVNGLAFRQDKSLSLLTPSDGDRVPLPVTVTWRSDRDGAGQLYAVFVDRSPVRPGQHVGAAVDEDLCRGVPGCPDDETLRRAGVYVTKARSLRLEAIPARSDDPDGAHDVRVIRLDPDRRRIGENAHGARFFVERPPATGRG